MDYRNVSSVIFHVLTIQTSQWYTVEADDFPETDDFAHAFDQVAGIFYYFGGYCNGEKVNSLNAVNMKNLKKVIKLTEHTRSKNPKVPSSRTGARMVKVESLNCLLMFGGLNKLNETLNDMWKYDIEMAQWSLVKQDGAIPGPRCGHSMSIHNDMIFLFGGLIEVTHESSEVFQFDPKTNRWEQINTTTINPYRKTSTLVFESYGNIKK